MRLLNTSTLKLHEFFDDDIPEYAILSHTWGKEEVSFHDLQNKKPGRLDGLKGYMKIKACCALAKSDSYKYVWIDTCCIDKTSSSELSEAINSMYQWYRNARVCYVYLVDVWIGKQREDSLRWAQEFRESRWFTRGWTLQELLAPRLMLFFDKDWGCLGDKASLKNELSSITGIQQDHIFKHTSASAAQKMSWASGRKTTRLEDMAYSLMGIFNVNMPLLYGEGSNAFIRLQHEIVKISDDESIFAWEDDLLLESGMFAQSPKAFATSDDIIPINDDHLFYVSRAPLESLAPTAQLRTSGRFRD
ncbi:heterokaryon incompatibility protein-domain-containing protein [Usnea florida]